MTLSHRIVGQRLFSYPLFLFLVITVLIGILIANGTFEIQRTRSQLFNLLETEGLLVIKGLEKNSGPFINALTQEQPSASGQGVMIRAEESLGIEDLLVERLINLALQLDQEGSGGKKDSHILKEHLTQSGLSRVFFLKPDPHDPSWEELPAPLKTKPPFFRGILSGKTRLSVFRGQGTQRSTIALAVAVALRSEPGIILIPLSPEEYGALSRQIVIQGFLEDYSGKGNVAYLWVEAQDGRLIAQAGGKSLSERTETLQKKAIRSGDSSLFWIKGKEGDFLEIVRPFRPGGKELGLLHLGLSLKEVTPILNQGRRVIVFMGLVLFGLGLVSLIFIFRLQGRNLQKMRAMEEQIRLKEELSAMGQLAAGVAHEIKNHLNAIGLVVQRLQQEFVRDDPDEQKEYERFTGIVRSEISRVNQIIGHFLMVAKPLEIRLEDCSVIDILDYVLEVMGEEFRQKKIQVITEWGNAIPLIRSDRFQLTQAFLNILNNALEALVDGGEIRLSVQLIRSPTLGLRSSKKIDLKLRINHSELDRDFIEISVRDTGKGIPPEGLKRIFAHYYTTKEKGVGLGLAITQKIIQAHEGILEVRSQENEGTTVMVRLPLSPLARGQEGSSPALPTPG
jgi:signal transduction histidine kinase